MDNEDPNKCEQFVSYNGQAFILDSLGFSFDRTPVDAEHAACKDVNENYYKQLFTGSVDVHSTFKQMEADFKAAGVDKLIAEMQRQYDAWLASK